MPGDDQEIAVSGERDRHAQGCTRYNVITRGGVRFTIDLRHDRIGSRGRHRNRVGHADIAVGARVNYRIHRGSSTTGRPTDVHRYSPGQITSDEMDRVTYWRAGCR